MLLVHLRKRVVKMNENVAPFPPDVDDVISPLLNASLLSIADESNTFSEVIDMAVFAQTKLQALYKHCTANRG